MFYSILLLFSSELSCSLHKGTDSYARREGQSSLVFLLFLPMLLNQAMLCFSTVRSWMASLKDLDCVNI